MKRLLLIISAACLSLLLLAVVSLWGVTSWLESAAGRVLLQNKLSDALGLEARLEGDYSLHLFPRILVRGEKLVLLNAVAEKTAARLDAFDLRIALRPLLRKQIDIQRVSLRGGSINMEAFGSTEAAPGELAQSPGSQQIDSRQKNLPKINFLEISDLMMRMGDRELLLLERMELKDFSAGQPAPVELTMGLAGEAAVRVELSLAATISVQDQPWQVLLNIQELSVSYGEKIWDGIHGSLEWDQPTGMLNGQLAGNVIAGLATNLEWSVRTTDDLSSTVAVEIVWPDGAVLTSDWLASQQSTMWLIEDVKVSFAEQIVQGAGCFGTKPRPLLQLTLQSEQLDIDAIRERLPAQDDAGTDSAEWPFDLAILLKAATLQSEEVIAHDVQLLVGAEPDCASPVIQSLE
jgi:hypothetical protein